MKLKLMAVLFGVLASLSMVAAAGAVPGNAHQKFFICHYTGSESNPVVIIHVSQAAGPAHIVEPGHGHQGDDQRFATLEEAEAACLGDDGEEGGGEE